MQLVVIESALKVKSSFVYLNCLCNHLILAVTSCKINTDTGSTHKVGPDLIKFPIDKVNMHSEWQSKNNSQKYPNKVVQITRLLSKILQQTKHSV